MFKQLRKEKGYSVAQAAKWLEISESHLLSIENGNRKPSKRVIKKMVELYGASVEVIFFAS